MMDVCTKALVERQIRRRMGMAEIRLRYCLGVAPKELPQAIDWLSLYAAALTKLKQ